MGADVCLTARPATIAVTSSMTSRTCLILLLPALLTACSTAPKTGASPRKHAWYMPWGGGRVEDATPYLEYRKTREEGGRKAYALSVRNTHPTNVIVGEARMTLETGARESRVISQSFTLTPSETQKLLVYPEGSHLTYEVTAAFRE
jgi:hypothetical protein